MTLKKLALPILIAGCLGVAHTPAIALEAGDVLVRGRIIHVAPDSDSDNVISSATGGSVPDTNVEVDSATTLDIDITYMFTKNIGAELLLDIPAEHDINSEGSTLTSLAPGTIITTRVLPPALILQYHFIPDGMFRPYVGAGLNYTLFFDEEATDSLKNGLNGATDLDLDSSFGLALQAGFDYDLGNDWFVNADLKYIDMETTATFNTGALGRVEVDVDINPWIIGVGIGRRFSF